MIFFIFVISILIHEISHIVIGKIFKCKLKKIRILPVGFFIEFKDFYNNNFIKKILIILAGPVSNFWVAFFWVVFECSRAKEICLINLALGIFNLLPIYPLDGEHILEIILKKLYGYKNGELYAFFISKSFLCVITFIYSCVILKIKNISILFVIGFLWYKNFEKEKQIKLEKSAYKVIEKTLFKY